jgi:glycosyltransferase involved in cell wall biosynthesis
MFMGDLAGTGFGTVTMDLGRALLDLGHDVRFVSQNEIDDLEEPFASRTFRVNDRNGWLALTAEDEGGIVGIPGLLNGKAWADGWVAEACILLGDFAALRMVLDKDPSIPAAFTETPTFHYVPIEGVGLPNSWADVWGHIHPVAMTEFGADEIAKVMPERPPVVYHGVDTSAFWPVSPERPIYLGEKPNQRKLRSKADCKAFFDESPDARDKTWILRTDRHMPRKRYNAWIRGLAPVLATRPNTHAVIHCRTQDQGGDLRDTLSKMHPKLRSRYHLLGLHDPPFDGISRAILNALYNAADLYVSVSAEGFGLTIAEALACGVPAVGLDYSAVPEVIGPGGKLVPVAHLLDNEYDHFWAAVDERALGRIVTEMLDNPEMLREYGRAGARHIRDTFTWSQAARQFTEIIAAAVPQKVAA